MQDLHFAAHVEGPEAEGRRPRRGGGRGCQWIALAVLAFPPVLEYVAEIFLVVLEAVEEKCITLKNAAQIMCFFQMGLTLYLFFGSIH